MFDIVYSVLTAHWYAITSSTTVHYKNTNRQKPDSRHSCL